jgi:hypothetical protein
MKCRVTKDMLDYGTSFHVPELGVKVRIDPIHIRNAVDTKTMPLGAIIETDYYIEVTKITDEKESKRG